MKVKVICVGCGSIANSNNIDLCNDCSFELDCG